MQVLDNSKIPKLQSDIVGGFSAIEYHRDNKDKSDLGKWIIISDKKPNVKGSNIFENQSIDGPFEKLLLKHRKIPGLENAESIRYNYELKTYFFAIEEENKSKVGFLDKKGEVANFYSGIGK